jgi:hypothetical protein
MGDEEPYNNWQSSGYNTSLFDPYQQYANEYNNLSIPHSTSHSKMDTFTTCDSGDEVCFIKAAKVEKKL